MVGDVLISVHAKCGKNHQTNESADSVQRAIGNMQSSCIAPERQQNPWHQVQGGVVGHGGELGQWDRNDCTRTCLGDVSVSINQKLFMHASGLLCVFNLVSVLFVLHGSGAGSVLLIRYPCSWL